MNFTRTFSYFFTRMYSYVPVRHSYVSRMLVVCIRMYPYVPYVTHIIP